MTVGWQHINIHPDKFMAACWLHDVVEDCGVTVTELAERFGNAVANGVWLLSDMEAGTRAERKAASRKRLAGAPPWVQTIKVADLISNTASIVQHDPGFAVTYLAEKRALLEVLRAAHPGLLKIALEQAAP